MPSVLLAESATVELGSQEPWPNDAKFFQPLATEQLLLPDAANCLAVQAFLKICQLKYAIEMRSNAENMSPSGKVPFIKCGPFVISELDSIVAFVNAKGIRLTENLDANQTADVKAYSSMVSVLANAELYFTWCHEPIFKKFTCPRYGSVFPWPLNHLLCWKKRNQVKSTLAAKGWTDKTIEEIYEEVEICCNSLQERLGANSYFFGDKPTELDALVFGHLFTLLTTQLLPEVDLTRIVGKHPQLIEHCRRIEQKYFHESVANGPEP